LIGSCGGRRCPQCNKIFDRRVQLERHQANEHGKVARIDSGSNQDLVEVFQSTKHRRELKPPSKLGKRALSREAQDARKCDKCERVLSSKRDLDIHIKNSEYSHVDQNCATDAFLKRAVLSASSATACSTG
jgi:uncharacterized C2H2 Zn-finger protein